MFNPFKNLFENPIKKKHVQQGNVWVKRLRQLLTFVADGSATALEMFWRKEFGDNYLNIQNVGRSMTVLIVTIILLFTPDAQQESVFQIDRLVMVAFTVFTLLNFFKHRAEIESTKNNGIERHSHDNGISFFTSRFNVEEFKAKRWFETGITFLVGTVLTFLGSYIAGSLFQMGALMVWWRERQLQHKAYQAYQSIIDSRIDAQQTKQVTQVGWQQYQATKNTQQQNAPNGQRQKPTTYSARRSK